MRKVLFAIFGLLLLAACEKEPVTPVSSEVDAALEFRSSNDKVDVCHYSEEEQSWRVINISTRAVAAHKAHGDAVDLDGDGFFDGENGCREGIDCDDDNPAVNPDATEECGDGIDNDCDGQIDEDCAEYIIVNGKKIYIQPAGSSGFSETYWWNEANKYCNELVLNGSSNWRLPNRPELEAMYAKRNDIGDFDQSGNFDQSVFPYDVSSWYWSSVLFNSGSNVIVIDFSDGKTYSPDRFFKLRCRCVRE